VHLDVIVRLPLAVALCVAMLLLTACATPRVDVPKIASHAIDDAQRTPLGRAFESQAAGASGFQLLSNGRAAFAARMALADSAVRSLDLQYYSAGSDLTTDLLLSRLAAAAARGVRVRLLLDDIHAPSREFARRAAALHPNIQARLFNPFRATSSLGRLLEFAADSGRLNRRMHNKLWVADNAVAILGSRNLGDEYFDASNAGNFVDVDLLTAGPSVREMSAAFDRYWNSDLALPIEAIAGPADPATAEAWRAALTARITGCDTAACRWSDTQALRAALQSGSVALTWAPARLFVDPPDQDKRPLSSGLEHGWLGDDARGGVTRRELLLVSPYLIPSDVGLAHLGTMHERGVRIAALTNSLASTDSPAAHAGYANHRPHLLQHNVELYELRTRSGRVHRLPHRWGDASPDSLHAKLIVQDRSRVLVGSFNQDPRSRLHNTEMWVAIESAELAADLAAWFEEATDSHHAYKVVPNPDSELGIGWISDEGGAPVRHSAEPGAGVWLLLWRGLLSALPEHML
jgi:cardiolipin synthase C